MSNEQETVSVSIPAPPKGWKIDGYRNVSAGEYMFMRDKWVAWHDTQPSVYKYPCAIREQSEAEKPEYEEIPVYTSEHGWQIAGDWLPAHWACRDDFAGAIYEHPNGHRLLMSTTCPVFVDPCQAEYSWSFSVMNEHGYTHMISPVAIRRKVAK